MSSFTVTAGWSRDAAHLGHNLPSGGRDRYCIDLVCIAGEPLTADNERFEILSMLEEPVTLSGDEVVDGRKQLVIGALSILAAVVASFGVYVWKKKRDGNNIMQAKVNG